MVAPIQLSIGEEGKNQSPVEQQALPGSMEVLGKEVNQ